MSMIADGAGLSLYLLDKIFGTDTASRKNKTARVPEPGSFNWLLDSDMNDYDSKPIIEPKVTVHLENCQNVSVNVSVNIRE